MQYNIDPDQYVGQAVEQIFGDQADIVRSRYLETFQGQEVTFELKFDQQYQQYRTVPLVADDESISRILVVVENITERKQAEETMQAYTRKIERMNQLYVDREARMIALKREVNTLLAELGRSEKYLSPVQVDELRST